MKKTISDRILSFIKKASEKLNINRKIILNSLGSFVITAISAIVTSFLPLILAYLFTPYVNGWKHTRGDAYVQTLLSAVGFVLFLLMTSWIAFLRGKRKTKKKKLTNKEYRQVTSIGMGAYILSAIILVMIVGNVESTIRIIALYLPFLFLKSLFRIVQLSIITLGFISWICQAGTYALGKRIWEKNKEKY